MSLFLSITLNGVAQGAIFAAVALALVLIYRSTKVVNFAQGAMGMMTTFIAFSLLNRGLGYWPAVAVVLVIAFVFGALVERLLIRPLHGKPQLNLVIVTIGLLIVLEGIAGCIWGNASRGFPAAFSQNGLHIGRTAIAFSRFDLFIVLTVLGIMGLLLAVFRWTDIGLKMRASAFAPEMSRLLGVRVGRLLTLGWASAAVAGAIAALMVAPLSSFSPYYMDLDLIYGFTAAVVGGLESPVGAGIGGLVTGLSISYVGGYLGSSLQPMAALAVLMIALMARPEGIFSRPAARRV